MIITPSFSPFSTVVSNQRLNSCGCAVDVGFVKLLLELFGGYRVLKMNIEFCCDLCCSTSLIYRHNPVQCIVIPFS